MGAGHKAASGEDQIAMAAASREKDAASNEIQTQEGESSVSQAGAVDLVERATGATWMAAAKNPKNDKEIDETRKLLNETVVDKNRFITTFKSRNGNTYMWGGLTLDDAGVKKVRADPRIKYVEEEPVEVDDYVIPNYGEDDTSATWYEYDTKAKRAVDDWIKVDPAPKNLAIINQAPNTNQKDYNYFVYEKHGGDGTYVYVMDGGVSFNVEYDVPNKKREFLSGKSFGIQTQAAAKANKKEDVDDKANSHGTGVASVALGQRFGVAKQATLISVKSLPDFVDKLESFDMVYADIAIKNPGRVKKAIVVMSVSYPPTEGGELALDDAIRPLLDLGVPVVVSSGNERQSHDESTNMPAKLYQPDFPIIVVGGTDVNGNRVDSSQGSDKNAVHAPGQDVDVSDKDGSKKTKKGTSFAAPAVAGLLASYMAYDRIPWDDGKTNKDRPAEIRRFLQQDSSVARGTDSKIKTIWNRISADDYKNAKTANQPSKPSTPGQCHMSVIQRQTLYSPQLVTYSWDGLITGPTGETLCDPALEKGVPSTKDYAIDCKPLKDRLNVHIAPKELLEFKIGDQSWNSDDKSKCINTGWRQDNETPMRLVACDFKCAL